MSWLQHNVVADLYGPYFLVFYAMVIAAVIVACYKSVRSADRTGDLDPPQIAGKLDPYEIAYLRGGENEVARVALASLVQRGWLKINERKKWYGTLSEIARGRTGKADKLAAIESCVLNWPGFPAQPTSIFQLGGLAAVLKSTCAHYEAALAERNLLTPKEMKEIGMRLWLIGSALILGLGGYKLWAALVNGHNNVILLCIIGPLGVLFLAAACLNPPRISRLGKSYLERLKLAYINLKDQVKPDGKLATIWDDSVESGNPGKGQAAVNDAACLLMVGVFGVGSLAGTPLSNMTTMFARGTSSSGGCGGGCGGGGGGCGGGGGGCGGGGGGCGGSGCGGGGCGGCGG